MAGARRPLSSVQVTIRIQPDTTSLDRALASLDQLVASPALITQLLRNAVAETLLAAYRRRFLDNFEKILSPELAGKKGRLASTTAGVAAKQELTRAYAAVSEAEAKGDRAGLTLARKRLDRAEQRLVGATQNPKGSSELSTGHFRELATQVLRLMTDSSLVATQADATEVQLGIANLGALNAVQTPSATPKLTGHPTASSMTTMWRQLEFGTGVYAGMAGATARSPHGWWFGKKPGHGLELLGAQGVHAVFDAATGLPYDRDAVKFEEVFAGLLGRALAGR